jgi:REP element-mobilizing transposase RayT
MTRDALRIGRYSESGRIYLVTTATLERRPVFDDFACARGVVGEMRRLVEEGRVASLAWVVMPDHLHWLLQLGEHADLSGTIRALKGRSAHRLGGPLWQRAFHDRAVRKDDDLPTAARYIVANPLRAGLVTHLGDYPHWDAVWL